MVKGSSFLTPIFFSGSAFSGLVLLGLSMGCGGGGEPPAATGGQVSIPEPADLGAEYFTEVEAWHTARVERLKEPTSWLSLVGLFWLKEGENSFGSGEGNDLVFPEAAPPRAGTLLLEAGQVTLTAAPGVSLNHEGQGVTVLEMASDATQAPTQVDLGSFQFYVLDREGRIGLRLKDREAPAFTTFEGIDRFEVDPHWRLEARWEPYDSPRTVFTPNVLGSAFEEESPGVLVFSVGGEEVRLEPTSSEDGSLFLVFGDATNGESTYGGGRFLTLEAPRDGKVIVDFNRSYNPPCVFTPYATCPLPRRENRAPIEIRAGEKMWGGHHEV